MAANVEVVRRNPKGAAAVIDWSVEEILYLRQEILDLKQDARNLQIEIDQQKYDSCECWKKPVYRSGICTETSCVRTLIGAKE